MSKFIPTSLVLAALSFHPGLTVRAGILDDLYSKKPAGRPTPPATTAAARPVSTPPAAAIPPAPDAPEEDEFVMPLVIAPTTADSGSLGLERYAPSVESSSPLSKSSSDEDEFVMPVATNMTPTTAPCGYDPNGKPIVCRPPVAGRSREVRPTRLSKFQEKMYSECQSLKRQTCYPACPPYWAVNYGYSPTHWRRLPDIAPQFSGGGSATMPERLPTGEMGAAKIDPDSAGNNETGVLLLPPPLTPGASPKQDP